MSKARYVGYAEEDFCKWKKCIHMDYIQSQRRIPKLNEKSNNRKILENIDKERVNYCETCPATEHLRWQKNK